MSFEYSLSCFALYFLVLLVSSVTLCREINLSYYVLRFIFLYLICYQFTHSLSLSPSLPVSLHSFLPSSLPPSRLPLFLPLCLPPTPSFLLPHHTPPPPHPILSSPSSHSPSTPPYPINQDGIKSCGGERNLRDVIIHCNGSHFTLLSPPPSYMMNTQFKVH